MVYEELMKPNEDWRALPEVADRRRIQNRLVQRAYRRNLRKRNVEVEQLTLRVEELQNVIATMSHVPASIQIDQSSSPVNPNEDCVGDLIVYKDQLSGLFDSDLNFLPTAQSAVPESFDVTSSSMDTITTNPVDCMAPIQDAADTAVHSQQQRPYLMQFPSQEFESGSQKETWSVQFENSTEMAVYEPIDRRHDSLDPYGMTAAQLSSMTDLQGPGQDRRHSSAPQDTRNNFYDGHHRLKLPDTEPKNCDAEPDQQNSAPCLVHLAVSAGNADTLRLLLHDLRLCTNRKDKEGFTPLQRAVSLGRADLVRVLLDYRATNMAAGENYCH